MADEKPSITDAQRAEILRRVRSGYDLEAAAVDCGVDAVAAMRDPALVRDFPAAYAVGSSRIRARTLEAAIAKGDASALIRFNDKREVATQAALEQINGEASTLGDWLTSLGLEPPPDRSAVEWFVDLFQVAAGRFSAERLTEQRARDVLEAAGHYDVVPITMREKYARRVLTEAGYIVTRFQSRAPEPLTPAPDVIDVAQEAPLRPARIAPNRDPNHSLADALRAGRATLIGRS